MPDRPTAPDYKDWPLRRLREEYEHRSRILLASAGRDDPHKPELRAELIAIREEITRRASEGETQ